MLTQLYYSNHIEELARTFIDTLPEQLSSGLTPPLVIVPNPYLKKWLQLRIADTLGIAANINFQYMENGLWLLADRSGNNPEQKPRALSADDLQFMVYAVLSNNNEKKQVLKPLYAYINKHGAPNDSGSKKKMWQLAGQLAGLFLEYQLYRPRMIRGWLQGATVSNRDIELCQAHVYRLVFQQHGLRDQIGPLLMTLPQYWESIRTGAVAENVDTAAVSIFGLTQLTPWQAEFIYETGSHVALTLYSLNPCAEFWEDVTTPAEDRWLGLRSVDTLQNSDGEYLAEPGDDNALLKLWAKPARETIKMLSALEEAEGTEGRFESHWATYEPGEQPTVLNTIQEQILFRTARNARHTIPQDHSLQVAACPDIFREVEMVYHSIIKNLEYTPGLMMTDIAVMVPDMDMYAPLVKAVFDKGNSPLRYSLIDRSAVSESLLVQGVLALFSLYDGSFSRKELFEIFYNPLFMARHNLEASDVDSWLQWASRLNIYHSYTGQGGTRAPYSWKQGLRRLRLGRIMQVPENEHDDGLFRHYEGLVPYSDMESGEIEIINSFSSAVFLLNKAIDNFKKKRSGKEWQHLLLDSIDSLFLVPDSYPEELSIYTNLIQSLSGLKFLDEVGQGSAVYDLDFVVVRDYTEEKLKHIPSSEGSYLASGINISALVPKRQIPFKVVYVLGMGEGIFPGNDTLSQLDLRTQSRKIGDLSLTDGNNYLFMETLLSTRNKLYLSYVAHDLQRDQELYPNSLLEQLIAYIETNVTGEECKYAIIPLVQSDVQYLEGAEQSSWTDLLLWEHAGGVDLVNSSDNERLLLYLAAAQDTKQFARKDIHNQIQTVGSNRIPDFGIANAPEGEGTDSPQRVSMRELRRFLVNPIDLMLGRHLNVYNSLRESENLIEDEPFYSTYPYDMHYVQHVLQEFIQNREDREIAEYMTQYYTYASLKGQTPDRGFALADNTLLEKRVRDMLGSETEGLTAFIEGRKNAQFYRQIVLGEDKGENLGVLYLDEVKLGLEIYGSALEVNVRGELDNIWVNAESGLVETIQIVNSSELKPRQLITPFLFYILARCGAQTRLSGLFGDFPFVVHIVTKKSMTSVTYDLQTEYCLEYILQLFTAFFDYNGFDLLPFDIAVDKKLLCYFDDITDVNNETREQYQNLFLKTLETNQDNLFSTVHFSSVLQLVDPVVPPDAYDKVRNRIYPVIAPLLTEAAK